MRRVLIVVGLVCLVMRNIGLRFLRGRRGLIGLVIGCEGCFDFGYGSGEC